MIPTDLAARLDRIEGRVEEIGPGLGNLLDAIAALTTLIEKVVEEITPDPKAEKSPLYEAIERMNASLARIEAAVVKPKGDGHGRENSADECSGTN
jgi:hypothetical protein